MKHCVGSYIRECLYSGSHIFSIRNQSGCPLSTFELLMRDDLKLFGKIIVGQHYGPNNSTPSIDCRLTLEKFVRHLNIWVEKKRFLEVKKQLMMRCQKKSEDYRNQKSEVWSQNQIQGFRELLHGYSVLEAIGQ